MRWGDVITIFQSKNHFVSSLSNKPECKVSSRLIFYPLQVDVMKVIYRYLQNTVIGNEEARKKLRNLPLVIVDLGYTLVKPRQVAINLFDDDQIIPYLYKVRSIRPVLTTKR